MAKKEGTAWRRKPWLQGANWLAPVPTVLLAWVLLVSLVLVLSGCGGGGGASDASPTQQPPAQQQPPAGSGQVPADSPSLQASQSGQLLSYAKAKLAQRQQLRTQLGLNVNNFSTAGDMISIGAVFSAGSPSAPTERSSTVVQEDGVDEDDFIKSDDSTIVTLSSGNNAQVGIHRLLANGGTPASSTQAVGNVALNANTNYTGLYLAASSARVAVLGSLTQWATVNFCAPAPSCASASLSTFPSVMYSTVALDIVDISNPSASGAVVDKLRIDGSLVGSRLIGNSLVLVTQHSPKLPVDLLPWNAPTAEREAAISRLTTADLLPTVTVNGGTPSPLVQETDCFIEPKNASYGLEITSITVVDLSSPTLQRSSRCFVGGTEAVYMSTSSLYLATSSHLITPVVGGGRLVYPQQISTDIHKFALVKTPGNAVTTVDFRGSGSVTGHLGWSIQQRSYRMSEHDGHLRVLTFTDASGWGVVTDASNPNAPAPSPATLTVLREATTGKTLQTVGQLPNKDRPQAIGKPGEQVYAVRFIGDRGYVVTFRQVDPLYILDLSQPNDPKTTGELTIAGFSDYLFPVGPADSGLLLGVGKDADLQGLVGGVKVALFDVRDPTKPEQKTTFTLGRRGSWSALDTNRHGIDLFTRGNQTRVVLPVLSTQISNFGNYTYSSALQRFEVDASTRSMKLISPLAPTTSYRSVSQDRTLQVGDMVHHFAPEVNPTSLASYVW